MSNAVYAKNYHGTLSPIVTISTKAILVGTAVHRLWIKKEMDITHVKVPRTPVCNLCLTYLSFQT